MNSKPAHSVDRPSADDEIIEQLNGEDPARFLYLCGEQSVTYTTQSILDGMTDPQRCQLWLRVEREVFGGRPAPMKRLAQAQARIQGLEEADIEVETHQDVPETDDSPSVDESDPHDHGDDVGDQKQNEDIQDEDFEARVQDALTIATEFDAETVRVQLEDERSREQPREHVIEALQRRLDELGADLPTTDADSATEVSA